MAGEPAALAQRPAVTTAPGTRDPRRGSARHLWALGAVVSVYVVLALSYSLMTPAGEANDEFDHVQYIEYIVQHGSIPRISVANGNESHQPPLYYLLVGAWQESLGIPAFRPNLEPGAPFQPGDMFHLAYSHRYTDAEHTVAVRVHELRLVSILLGLATVLLTYAAARLSIRDVEMSLSAAAFVAVLPKADVVASTVTNDALVIMLCSATLVGFLAWLRAESRRRQILWALGTGLAGGLAVISKFNSLPVVIFILALIAIVSIRRRDAFALPMAVLSCVSVSAWWLVRNAVLYGSPLAQGAANRYLTRLIPGLVHPVGWLNFSRFGQFVPRQLLSTAWYDGGWNQFTLPLWMNYALAALAILSLVCGGLVALGVLRAGNHRLSPWAGRALVLTVLGGFVAVIIIAKDTIQAEGRVTYVGLSAFATLCVAGLAWTGRSRRWSRHVCIWTWPVILAAVNVFVLFDIVIPFRSL